MTNNQGTLLRLFTFFNYSINALMLTVMPAYFHLLGLSKLQIGMLYSISPTVGIVANLFWGVMSDRLQKVTIIIRIVLVGELASMLLMFHFQSFGLILAVMVLFYFFQTPVSSLNDSQILLKIKNTGTSYASFRMFGSIGFAVAAVLYGLILSQPAAGKIAVLSIIVILMPLCTSFFMENTKGSMKKMNFTGLYAIFASRPFMVFLSLVFLIGMPVRTNDGYMSLYLLERGASQTLIGYSWMVAALCEIPAFYLLSRYGDRFRELPLMALAAGAFFVRMLLTALPVAPEWIVGVQVLHSVSFGVFYPTAIRYIQQLIPDEYRASGQAVFAVVWSGLSGLCSGFIGGSLFEAYGGQTMFIAAGCMALLAMIGFLTAARLEQKGTIEEKI